MMRRVKFRFVFSTVEPWPPILVETFRMLFQYMGDSGSGSCLRVTP